MHDETTEARATPATGGEAASGSISGKPKVEQPDSVSLDALHRVSDFVCARSSRVTSFLRDDAAKYVASNFARVFILPSPSDPTEIWGYYSLSAFSMPYEAMGSSDQKRVPEAVKTGIPVPFALLGYMGRDSNKTTPGFGEAIVLDAARRVYHSRDIAAWGIILDAEGRQPKLMAWYETMGFKVKKVAVDETTGVMLAPLTLLIPELMSANLIKQREKAKGKRQRAKAKIAT